MKIIKKKAILFATVIIAFSSGSFTATSDWNTMPMTLSETEIVATNPFTFDPILESNLRPNIPQGDDEDKQEDIDSSETSQPVVIDSGTLV